MIYAVIILAVFVGGCYSPHSLTTLMNTKNMMTATDKLIFVGSFIWFLHWGVKVTEALLK
jgi:hypothetical protein